MSAPEREQDLKGPIESRCWPEKLQARVITPGNAPAVHGYAIESDIARHYSFSDYLFLCLTGDLPDPPRTRAFDATLMFLGPISVAHASTHAAVVSRLCGARNSGTIGVAAIGLAEQARALVTQHAALLRWLAQPEAPFPAEHRAPDADPSVARFTRILEAIPFEVPALGERPTREAALLASLWALGLQHVQQLEAAIVLARMSGTLAESFAERETNFARYPIDLPRFRYRDPGTICSGRDHV